MTSNKTNLAPLYGLILSGGKSSRMGHDKAMLQFHGTSQLDHLTSILSASCQQVFISSKHRTNYPHHAIIEDQYDLESPLNGILSAMTLFPEYAWLVVACDMPFIDKESLAHLIHRRSTDHLATCYHNNQNMIEPLFSIWEPHALKALIEFQSKGELSPKRFLETHNTNIVTPLDYKVLTNVNTVEQFKKLRNIN